MGRWNWGVSLEHRRRQYNRSLTICIYLALKPSLHKTCFYIVFPGFEIENATQTVAGIDVKIVS